MGDVADMMLDGTLCQCCGEYIGEAVGFPRYCKSCRPKNHKPKKKSTKNMTKQFKGGRFEV